MVHSGDVNRDYNGEYDGEFLILVNMMVNHGEFHKIINEWLKLFLVNYSGEYFWRHLYKYSCRMVKNNGLSQLLCLIVSKI